MERGMLSVVLLLLGLNVYVTHLVSTDPAVTQEQQEVSTEHPTRPVTDSGDLLSWERDVNMTGSTTTVVVEKASMDAMLVTLEKLTSRLELMTSHMGRVEELILNQTQELKVTLIHELKVTVKQAPDVNDPHNYQGDSAAHHKGKPVKEVSVGDKGETFVLYSDEASPSRFYGDNHSLSQDFQGWCDSHTLAGYGPPKTHAWIYKSGADLGAWLKDPLPRDLAERAQIWTQRRASHVDDRYTFQRYDNYSNFRSERSAKRRERSWWVDGLGSVVYQGALLFHYEKHLYRYDLRTEARQTHFLLTSSYTRGHYMYVRFHADEYGLWITYPNHTNFRLMLSKIDPVTLDLTETVKLEEDTSRLKGVWMACGVVWVLAPSVSSGNHINGGNHVARAVYDAHRGVVVNGDHFDVGLLYGYISQMTYNPREKVIFGWDNYHLLTWPVLWRKRA